MSDFEAIAVRVEIEALRGEFTDAGMQRDYDRLAGLFTEDGVWRLPHIDLEFAGRETIRAAVERLQKLWEYFVQTAHLGALVIDGDTATGRAYVTEFGRLYDGRSNFNCSIYHDRYRRTSDGWKFVERSYEIRYQDQTPLPGAGNSPEV
ncbi:nuclear transport factor 2 family protein [Kribbella sp. DT2]|uniref:nuclear transport factor 2 family protein n=1 Tax=Kribbella sp. DT2 TaxID=3393427 RepID=UPI003CF42DEF